MVIHSVTNFETSFNVKLLQLLFGPTKTTIEPFFNLIVVSSLKVSVSIQILACIILYVYYVYYDSIFQIMEDP